MDVEIRKMTSDDVDAAHMLECECFSHPWSREALMEEMSRDYTAFFVAEHDGKVIGYAGMMLVLDEAQVFNVAVSGAHRRLGAGTALTCALITEATRRGACVLMLEAREHNVAARALYEKCGFTAVGTRKNFYDLPTDNAVLYNYYIKKEC